MKQNKHTKAVAQNTNDGKNQSALIEQHESYDDSLLPDADELAKLKEIDPDCITWIKERAAKEQDARIDFNKRRVAVIEKSEKRPFIIDMVSLFFALIVIVLGMGFSFFLIRSGNSTAGSIFAGGTILIAFSGFLNFRKSKPPLPPFPKK